ncbi:unnamed protein product [Ectocarpus sp. 12 AP-2014]
MPQNQSQNRASPVAAVGIRTRPGAPKSHNTQHKGIQGTPRAYSFDTKQPMQNTGLGLRSVSARPRACCDPTKLILGTTNRPRKTLGRHKPCRRTKGSSHNNITNPSAAGFLWGSRCAACRAVTSSIELRQSSTHDLLETAAYSHASHVLSFSRPKSASLSPSSAETGSTMLARTLFFPSVLARDPTVVSHHDHPLTLRSAYRAYITVHASVSALYAGAEHALSLPR